MRLLTWLLALLPARYEIGRRGVARYLTRWVLKGDRFKDSHGKVFLHVFHASDYEDALHDHPWDFWSLIVWGGYYEVTEDGRKWYGPGSLLRRPAEWKHRVELHEDGRKAVTLLWTSDKRRPWGFWCPKGWRGYKEFDQKGGCE